MKRSFNHTCLPEKVYKKYYIDDASGKPVITADLSSETTRVCPFDNASETVLEYLLIGYNAEIGVDTVQQVLNFVSKYGLPKRGAKKVNAEEFAEEAQALYLHCCEITAAEYPENPEWILETENETAIIRRSSGDAYIEWQTKNLSAAIELAYTLLICGNDRYIGICKHCGRPFAVINPKSEFCSAPCRNRYNVYKSRAKNS